MALSEAEVNPRRSQNISLSEGLKRLQCLEEM
jgi:hypothetical protein